MLMTMSDRASSGKKHTWAEIVPHVRFLLLACQTQHIGIGGLRYRFSKMLPILMKLFRHSALFSQRILFFLLLLFWYCNHHFINYSWFIVLSVSAVQYHDTAVHIISIKLLLTIEKIFPLSSYSSRSFLWESGAKPVSAFTVKRHDHGWDNSNWTTYWGQ